MSLKQQTFTSVIWSAIERFSVQGVQFILSLIIARQLMPSDYGLIAMLSIFMAIAQCFVDSGFSSALIQKQNRTNIDFSTVFYFNIVIGICMYLVFIICAPLISKFYEQPILIEIITWLGLNFIINSFATVQSAILTINLDFRRQAFISLTAVIISGLIAIYLAINGYGVWTLVIQNLLAASINVVLLWITSKWRPQVLFSTQAFKELFSFGSKLLMGGLLHTIYSNLYTLTIGKIFPVRELGYYSKANSLCTYPSANITSIINRVSFPILCKMQNDDKSLTERFYLIIRLSTYIVFPMMIGLGVIAEPLIKVILTDKWLDAVPYIKILCLAHMWSPVMLITWSLLNVKHRSDYSLKSEIIKKIIAITILIVTIPMGMTAICWGFAAYSICDITIILFFTRKILPKVNHKTHIKNILPIFMQSIIMGLLVFFTINQFTETYIQISVGIIVGLLSYFFLSHFITRKEFLYIVNLIKKH